MLEQLYAVRWPIFVQQEIRVVDHDEDRDEKLHRGETRVWKTVPDRDGARIIIGSEFLGDTSTGVSLFTTAPLNPR